MRCRRVGEDQAIPLTRLAAWVGSKMVFMLAWSWSVHAGVAGVGPVVLSRCLAMAAGLAARGQCP
jgi:hypothetical protein